MKGLCTRLLQISLVGLLCSSAPAIAEYPERPIRMIIGLAPGGGTDIVGRLLAETMSRELKQSVVVENKPGAGAMLGAAFVAGAPADGYTLLMGTSAELTIGPNLQGPRYDQVKDFIPIGMVGASPNVLLANPTFAPKTLKDLIEYAKANPGKVFYGSGGIGTSPHMSGELLKRTAGIDITHVGYKGSGPALTDLVTGQTQLMMSTMAPSMPFIQSGQVRPIAVTSLKRSPLLPETPTVAEQGFPGFEAVTWYALLAPAATPSSVLAKLRSALDQALTDRNFVTRLEGLGIMPDEQRLGSDAVRGQIERESQMWARTIEQNKIKPE